MKKLTPASIIKTYVTLTLFSTFASSFIWGVNTLFLLDAGLSITEAFAANAFFTVGQVFFEVPTGVVADAWGRRVSYLLGTVTLFGSTLMYLYFWQISAPFAAWALASIALGLGFTFFSGATEAWLVDALKFTKYKGTLESVFARGQIAMGTAMLSGTVLGGVVAQATNLGVPYILRIIMLGLTFVVAWFLMHDVGFTPDKKTSHGQAIRNILRASYDHGFRNPPVRWVMLAWPFTMGVGVFAFYAMQPYLLDLYGDPNSYAIAGLAAAIVAGAQIGGGFMAPLLHRLFSRRTTILFTGSLISAVTLGLIGLSSTFWPVLIVLVIWATMFAALMPVRQAYINDLIPSAQRATVLSSDNLISSTGGVVLQPALGKAADVWSYGTSYLVGAGIQLFALPFLLLARQTRAVSDSIDSQPPAVAPETPAEPLKT